MNGRGRILVVDDDPNAVKVLSAILVNEGYDVCDASDAKSAIRAVVRKDIDLVITDIKMPGMSGVQLFEYLRGVQPDIPIVFLTAYGSIEGAVDALAMGSYYYFIKPPDYSKLRTIVSKAVEERRLKKEIASLRELVTDKDTDPVIVGNSPAVLKMKETIRTVKDSESSVLITGETGTGKELIARSLHYSSAMKNKPFVAMSCAAIPRELLEAELFGFEKGAFTGALSLKPGKFEAAAGGTLFLDEIAELEINLQVKLLRVLQERELERLGSNKKIDLKFRLISSTNRDLGKEIKAGRFREDLFYRINVVHISVPPLRDRREDIPLLALKFIKEMCMRENKTVTAPDEVMAAFQNYHWPGNIRQLRNVVERAVLLAKGDRISLKDLPIEFSRARRVREINNAQLTLKEIERDAIRNVLIQCDGNKSEACRILGISRKAFYKRLREHEFM